MGRGYQKSCCTLFSGHFAKGLNSFVQDCSGLEKFGNAFSLKHPYTKRHFFENDLREQKIWHSML